MTELSLTAVFDAVTEGAADRAAIVWRDVRRTYAEVAERTRGLAGFLSGAGLGARAERADLDRWACGQATVALLMHNRPEYLETMLGCFRARCAPVNVNYQYTAAEVRSLLQMVGAEAVVYERALGPLLAEALAGDPVVLVDVDDGSGVPPLAGSTGFEAAIAAGVGRPLPEPSPDDLYLVCTGGTTGLPKAVLWRQADIFAAAMNGTDDATEAWLTERAAASADLAWFAAPPLMHAAAQWTAFGGLHTGAKAVLHDDRQPFDAEQILAIAEAERVTLVSIVGDAYARPMVEALRARPYDLGSLQRIGTGGAATSAAHKAALLELLPHVVVMDGYGASETGGMAFGANTQKRATEVFQLVPGGRVLSADRTRFLSPGEDEVGWASRAGRVPLGYLDQPAATEATFPIIDGIRVAIPGDRATIDTDGRIHLLGRDSMVVNTGGEKVFVEEVEDVLRRHPAVADALVVGRPNERFGHEVVAVVQCVDDARPTPGELREFCATELARFKAPRAVAFTDRIGRHPTGKPDYQWAREQAVHAVGVDDTGS
jgi:fatty-acyl-CoA synthase